MVSPTGLPHAVVFRERRRPVVTIRDDWLVQDRWWTDTPVDRHYYELVIDPGHRIVVFLDIREGTWFTHEQESMPAHRALDAPILARRATRNRR